MVGVDFCLLLCCADPWAGAGLFAFVKRSRGLVGAPRPPSHLLPDTSGPGRRDWSVGCPGGGRGGPRGRCRSRRRRLALRGQRVAFGPHRIRCCPRAEPRDLRRAFLSERLASRPVAHRMLPARNAPTFLVPNAGGRPWGGRQRPGAAGGPPLPPRPPPPPPPRSPPGAARAPSLPPAGPEFPAPRRREAAWGSGGTARGTSGPGRLGLLAF